MSYRLSVQLPGECFAASVLILAYVWSRSKHCLFRNLISAFLDSETEFETEVEHDIDQMIMG